MKYYCCILSRMKCDTVCSNKVLPFQVNYLELLLVKTEEEKIATALLAMQQCDSKHCVDCEQMGGRPPLKRQLAAKVSIERSEILVSLRELLLMRRMSLFVPRALFSTYSFVVMPEQGQNEKWTERYVRTVQYVHVDVRLRHHQGLRCRTM